MNKCMILFSGIILLMSTNAFSLDTKAEEHIDSIYERSGQLISREEITHRYKSNSYAYGVMGAVKKIFEDKTSTKKEKIEKLALFPPLLSTLEKEFKSNTYYHIRDLYVKSAIYYYDNYSKLHDNETAKRDLKSALNKAHQFAYTLTLSSKTKTLFEERFNVTIYNR